MDIEVAVSRDGATELWLLRVRELTEGASVEAKAASGATWTASADNLWTALRALRLQLDVEGVRLGLNAARRDVLPSRMSLQMSGGRMAYAVRLGHQATRADLVDVLAPAPVADAATVEEQDAYRTTWLASLG